MGDHPRYCRRPSMTELHWWSIFKVSGIRPVGRPVGRQVADNNNTTLWLHLASWNLLDSQLRNLPEHNKPSILQRNFRTYSPVNTLLDALGPLQLPRPFKTPLDPLGLFKTLLNPPTPSKALPDPTFPSRPSKTLQKILNHPKPHLTILHP